MSRIMLDGRNLTVTNLYLTQQFQDDANVVVMALSDLRFFRLLSEIRLKEGLGSASFFHFHAVSRKKIADF